MTDTSGKLLATTAGLLLMATVALASPPDPRYSTIDPIGVGDNSGIARGGSPAGYHVALRDVNNGAMCCVTVTLNFTGSGVRAYTTQNAGTTVDAAAQTLSRESVASAVNFAACTGGFNNSSAVQVTGNDIVLGSAKWRSTDIDGFDGKTGLGDLNYFSTRYLARVSAPECNFDLSGSDVPDLEDLTIFASEYLSGASESYAW